MKLKLITGFYQIKLYLLISYLFLRFLPSKGYSYPLVFTERFFASAYISKFALANWIKQYSEVQIDNDTVLTAQQIKALQKRNAQLEEENLILKKAIAIFTPHSDKD